MPKTKKPAPQPLKLSATEKMIQDCVKNARARKRSGETDDTWRKQYAATLKVGGDAVPLSQTPFAGDTNKKKL
ncbi:hypothetical protein [Telmatospirillum sp.]|uniref:hypothetical protein n=1 Tax=Telmatospirillum sp. TaxID=2079197 RepID=UPI00284ED7F2|nr:hypothetical protein [Telmatospirillum sp.]MDR3438503.1 hypothetical protein [Telmatospirillum sp.]